MPDVGTRRQCCCIEWGIKRDVVGWFITATHKSMMFHTLKVCCKSTKPKINIDGPSMFRLLSTIWWVSLFRYSVAALLDDYRPLLPQKDMIMVSYLWYHHSHYLIHIYCNHSSFMLFSILFDFCSGCGGKGAYPGCSYGSSDTQSM